MSNPNENIYAALGALGMGPVDETRAEEDGGMVTLYDGRDVAIGWVPRGDYDQIQETLAKRERERVVYRGPVGALRPVPR